MKRFYVLLAALGLVFFVSSCKNTMDLTKRRYTKGYHLEKHTAPSAPQEGIATQHKKEKVTEMEPIAQTLPVQQPESREVSGHLQQNPVLNGVQAAETKNAVVSIARKVEKISNTTTASQKVSLQQGSKVQKKGNVPARGGDSDVALVLLVILCLFPFINLIPVFIHDGHSATGNFWLTLILDILFFLPGIIWALLVVLDVADIS
jgi:uncharacterized membrane protein YqaE (UPF0057 family)